MAKQQETILRVWELGRGTEITNIDIRDALQELANATGSQVNIFESERLGFPSVAISSGENSQYMPIYNYLHSEGGTVAVVSSVIGKGEQIKAQELEKLYYKAVGAWNHFQYSMAKGKSVAQRLGTSASVAGIAGGIGAATTMAIKGSFKLMAKGIKALLRDQDAYDREMSFYKLGISLTDFAIGGVDSADIITRLRKQADEENVLAQYIMGNAYAEGRGVEPNEKSAIEWFEKAAANGELRSQNIVAGEYLYGETEYSVEQKNIGIQYLVNLAESGEDWAPQLILDIYGQGSVSGISIDYDKTVEYAEKFAAAGNIYSALILGQACDSQLGTDVPELTKYKDDERAAQLYKAVAETEHPDYVETTAMSLAEMYSMGRGVEKNVEESIHYYNIASRYGNLKAKAMLLNAYTFATGVEKSKQLANKYANEIIRSGDAEYLPLAYYSLFHFADAEEQYGDSIKYARQYIALPNSDDDRKTELQEYLDVLDEKISQMTDEERREFLKEPKKITFSVKAAKRIIISVALVVLIVFAIVFVSGRNENGYSGNYGEGNYEDAKPEAASSFSSEAIPALEAYNALLSQESFNRGSVYPEQVWYTDNCQFNIAMIDSDEIPELLVCNYVDADHASGWGDIYTYVDGEIIPYATLVSPDGSEAGEDIGYFEKTGYYMNFSMWQGNGGISIINAYDDLQYGLSKNFVIDENGNQTDVFYSIDGEECSEGEFYEELTSRTGGVKLTPYRYYENTEENRSLLFQLNNNVSQNKSEPSGDIKITSEEEAIQYAKDFGNIQEGDSGDFENVKVGCRGFEDGYYQILVYNDLGDHISTLAQWNISEKGYIYDVLMEEWIINEDGVVRQP